MKCPHCGEEFNAGKLMGSIRSEKKTLAAKKRGQELAKQWANAKKVHGELMKTVAEVAASVEVEEPVGVLPEKGPKPVAIQVAFEKPKEEVDSRRARFEELKAQLSSGTLLAKKEEVEDVPLSETPEAPFDISGDDGSVCRVAAVGKRGLGLWYVGEEGLSYLRMLKPGELETLWEKRIVK